MKVQKRIFTILFLSFVLLFAASCGSSRQSTIVQGRRGSAATLRQRAEEVVLEEETEEPENQGNLSGLYLLKKIDMEHKTVYLVKAGNGRQVQYEYETVTMFLDKYGNSKSQTSFLPGEAVEIQVASKTEKLQTLQVTDRVWVQENITNYSVAEGSHAITIGKTKYSYDADLPIFSNDTTVGFDVLEPGDEIRAVGMDKKIISLSITKGHGYLTLANTEIFDGSFICVGDKIFELVEPGKTMTVPEGTYLVTVANDGYGGSRKVTIERNMTTALNLDELKGEGPKTCKITFYVGIQGAILTIDGEAVDYSQPVEVRYGVHTIAVGAEGYDTVRNRLVVNSEEAEIEIVLTRTDTSSDTSQGNTDTGNNNNTTDGNTNDNNNNNTTNNNNNNTGSNTNNNAANNNAGNTTDNDAATDYLTTLYNLLTSINESGTGSGSTTSGILDDLKDQ